VKIVIVCVQVPIMKSEDRERVQLEGLREDIQTVCAFLSSPRCRLV
jgi:hypothetical protein